MCRLEVIDGEQVRDSRHPRVGRLGDDRIVLARRRAQKTLAVFLVDPHAGVQEGTVVVLPENRIGAQHTAGDLSDVDPFDGVAQYGTERDPRSVTDNQNGARISVQEERRVREEQLRFEVVWVRRCVGFSVHEQYDTATLARDEDGGVGVLVQE